MKLSEAKDIVQSIVHWHFNHMGIPSQCKPINASLEEMLKANKMVKKSNERALSSKSKKGSTTVSLTLDDRYIAAIFVAMSYQSTSSDNAESVASYQDKYVFVVHER